MSEASALCVCWLITLVSVYEDVLFKANGRIGERAHVDNGGRTSRPRIDTQSPKEIELMVRLRSALNKIFFI